MATIVMVERDVWDWLLYAVTAVAAVTAIVVFLGWAAELRRRPEIKFQWRLSPDGDPAQLAIWPPVEVPEIRPGQPLLVEAAILNTGDKAGRDALINFVAPDCFDLRQCEAPAVEPRHAGNDTVGLPPDHRVLFFAVRAEPWTPANWFMRHYRLQYVADQPDQALRLRLLFTVSDSRFNSRGRRLLPSIVPPLESRGAPLGAPWPPMPSKRRTVRWARAEPRGRVACLPGERSDVRDLIVLPADEGPAAAVTRSRGWRGWRLRPQRQRR
jgi:hypothetical protein